eukprot:3286340-Karenia_brevis.AAC.1
MLCLELKCWVHSGLNLEAFFALVDDNVGAGCYCHDDELGRLCERLATFVDAVEDLSVPLPTEVKTFDQANKGSCDIPT